MHSALPSLGVPPPPNQGSCTWWTSLHPPHLESANFGPCCTEPAYSSGCKSVGPHSPDSCIMSVSDELGDLSSDEDVFLPDPPVDFFQNHCAPPRAFSCESNDPKYLFVLDDSGCTLCTSAQRRSNSHHSLLPKGHPEPVCDRCPTVPLNSSAGTHINPSISSVSSTGFADFPCKEALNGDNDCPPDHCKNSNPSTLRSDSTLRNPGRLSFPLDHSFPSRTRGQSTITFDPKPDMFADYVSRGHFAVNCCCGSKPRLLQTLHTNNRCVPIAQTSSSILSSTRRLDSLFRLLLLPQPKSVARFSRLLRCLSPALDFTPKFRLPWHTANRNKPASRFFRGVVREDFAKYMMLYEHSNSSSEPVLSKSRPLGSPQQVTATTTVTASTITSRNCWLTPAEASRLKSKRHFSDDVLLANLSTPMSSVELLNPPISSSSNALNTDPKFSVVSVRTVRDHTLPSRDSTGHVFNSRTANNANSRLPLFLRRHSFANSVQPPPGFLAAPVHSLLPSTRSPPQHDPHASSFHPFVPASSSVSSYDWNSLHPSNLRMACPCCAHPKSSNRLHSWDTPPFNKDPGSVFVDLTGFDVTVSVERLPPVCDTHTRHQPYPAHLPLPSFTTVSPMFRNSFSVEERDLTGSIPPFFNSSNSPPTTIPSSPPPPYSECCYPSHLTPHTTGSGPPNPTESRAHHHTPPYNCMSYPWMSHAPTAFPLQQFVCSCQMCLSSHQALLNWHLLFPPTLLPSCCSSFSPWESCVASTFNFPSYLPSTTGSYRCHHSTFNQHQKRPTELDCPFCKPPATLCPPPASTCCQTCCCCCSSGMPKNNTNQPKCSFLQTLNKGGGAFGRTVPPDNFVRPASTAIVPSYVYIPEPIRVSRSQDVYNALRTCLVPHYELREYFNTAPPQRQWRKLDELSKDGFPFTLMCYNLLSPNYATPNQYPYCPSWALNWDYRRRSILDEIRIYHANIICLQEVETNQFEEIFKPELEKLKYDAVFLPKSRRRTMDTKDGKKVDGCAIFWQTDKFEKLHEFHHEFMISCSNVCEKPTPLILDRVMTRDNVALGVIFETKGSTGADGTGGRQFCVTTGHIHWDPEHSDVKMIQTILWTAELWAYIDQFLTGSVESSDRSSPTGSRSTPLATRLPVPGPSSPAANMPVILCGDLNSLPESGVVEFLMRGSLPKTHTDFLNNGFKYMFEDWRLLEKWAVDGDTLRHRFAFDRAYRESQGMKLTNFTYEFKGMIDYVLYTRQHFRLLGSLDQIHESWFAERKIVGCPHVHFPSDHFALLVELELKPTPQVSGLVAARRSARNRSHSETASDPGRSKVSTSSGSSPSSIIGGGAVTPSNRTRAESVGLERSGAGVDGTAAVNGGGSNSKQRKR